MKKVGNQGLITFRYVLISFFIIVFAGFISFKLFSTTIVDADKWNAKANAELQQTKTIAPTRGDILACDGTVLVTNLCYYTVRVDFRSEAFDEKGFEEKIDDLSDSLAFHFPSKTREEWYNTLWNQYDRPDSLKSRSFPLMTRLSYADLEKVRRLPFFDNPNKYKSGLIEDAYMKRDCPYGSMARRSIGRVGETDTCSEIHGISGLEKSLDHLLYGTPGVYKRVPLTKTIGEWTDIPAINGYNVTTTIDITLQDILEGELNSILDSCGAEWGTAILMEVATGDIKAIANLQRDDNGKYIEAYNRAVIAFEPGSVVKPISMMFALERGLANNPDSVISIGTNFPYGGGRPITDSHYNSALTVAGVIEQSSNIGMARIITRGFNDNPEAFVKCFENLGFFEKMNSGIAEEECARMPRHPSRVDMSRMCFGYATAIPPLYTLSVYNAIANDGKYVRPRLVKGLSRDDVDSIVPVSYIRESICSPANAKKLRYMLSQVVDGSHGTGRRLKNPYVNIAGKTGTCYHIDTITKHYDTSKKRLAFCGFFPAENPKYSCMVLTFHPTRNMFGAASTSGEVLKNVALKMYSRGLLGDVSDYRKDPPAKRETAKLNATLTDAGSRLSEALGTGNAPRRFKSPQGTLDGSIPNVVNLSLREALVKLEQSGYKVKFSGDGRVSGQQLLANNTVQLTLSNSNYR